MILTEREIRWLRLYKQGLVDRFDNLSFLLNKIDIQSQTEKDALFNINSRLKCEVDLEDVYEKATRVWYVRNTLFFIKKSNYPKVVAVNNLIGNWFKKKYLTTQQSYDDFLKIKHFCLNNKFVTSKMLIENNFNKRFISNWGGVFIELTRQGVVYNKTSKNIENNNVIINQQVDINELMIDYFNLYSPANLNDFKHWLGYSSKEINAVYEIVKQDFIELDNGQLVSADDIELVKYMRDIPIIILGKFDNICLGYKDKSWLIENSKQASVWGKAGIIESIVLCDGKVTAVWRKKRNEVLLKLLQKCSEGLICKIKNAICERFKNLVDVRLVNEFRCV